MNFGLVVKSGDRDEGIAATRETVAEIERIREKAGIWEGDGGGWGGWVKGGDVKWGGGGVEVKRRKRDKEETDAIKDNMATFFNPYANDRNKSKVVNHVMGLGEGIDLEVTLEVRLDDELRTLSQAKKTAHARDSIQDALPPQPPQ